MTKEQKFLLLVVLIIAGASVTYYYTQSGTPTSGTTQQTTATTQTTTTNEQAVAQNQIPAHSYSADVTYVTPEEGSEVIHVTINLSGDTINDITFTADPAKKRESKENIANFQRAFTALSFKGKKLSDVSLSRIGGASLTTNAFMEAVGKIKAEVSNG
jgi:uncharacterized protein (UPF0333 family)